MKSLVGGFLLASSAAMAQLVAGEPPPPRSLDDIVQRLAIGEIALVGTVVKQDLATDPSLLGTGRSSGGVLRTIRVESVICSGSDFLPGTDRIAVPEQVHVFISLDEGPMLDDPHPVEQLYIDARYLLILKKDPESANLVRQFGLDPSKTYYRAVAGERGAIQMDRSSYKEPEFFEMGVLNSPIPGFTSVKQRREPSNYQVLLPNIDLETREAAELLAEASVVCEALKPATMREKAEALERLNTPNARIALKILRGEPLR